MNDNQVFLIGQTSPKTLWQWLVVPETKEESKARKDKEKKHRNKLANSSRRKKEGVAESRRPLDMLLLPPTDMDMGRVHNSPRTAKRAKTRLKARSK